MKTARNGRPNEFARIPKCDISSNGREIVASVYQGLNNWLLVDFPDLIRDERGRALGGVVFARGSV